MKTEAQGLNKSQSMPHFRDSERNQEGTSERENLAAIVARLDLASQRAVSARKHCSEVGGTVHPSYQTSFSRKIATFSPQTQTRVLSLQQPAFVRNYSKDVSGKELRMPAKRSVRWSSPIDEHEIGHSDQQLAGEKSQRHHHPAHHSAVSQRQRITQTTIKEVVNINEISHGSTRTMSIDVGEPDRLDESRKGGGGSGSAGSGCDISSDNESDSSHADIIGSDKMSSGNSNKDDSTASSSSSEGSSDSDTDSGKSTTHADEAQVGVTAKDIDLAQLVVEAERELTEALNAVSQAEEELKAAEEKKKATQLAS